MKHFLMQQLKLINMVLSYMLWSLNESLSQFLSRICCLILANARQTGNVAYNSPHGCVHFVTMDFGPNTYLQIKTSWRLLLLRLHGLIGVYVQNFVYGMP